MQYCKEIKSANNKDLQLRFSTECPEDLLEVDANTCSPNSRNLPWWTWLEQTMQSVSISYSRTKKSHMRGTVSGRKNWQVHYVLQSFTFTIQSGCSLIQTEYVPRHRTPCGGDGRFCLCRIIACYGESHPLFVLFVEEILGRGWSCPASWKHLHWRSMGKFTSRRHRGGSTTLWAAISPQRGSCSIVSNWVPGTLNAEAHF